MVSESIPKPDVGVCLFGPLIHGTQRDIVFAWGNVYDIPHRIREKVLNVIRSQNGQYLYD